MKKLIHFLNVAILSLLASCIILLFGGIGYLAADHYQPADHHDPSYLIDEYEEELSPRSDYLFPRNDVFQEHDAPERIDL